MQDLLEPAHELPLRPQPDLSAAQGDPHRADPVDVPAILLHGWRWIRRRITRSRNLLISSQPMNFLPGKSRGQTRGRHGSLGHGLCPSHHRQQGLAPAGGPSKGGDDPPARTPAEVSAREAGTLPARPHRSARGASRDSVRPARIRAARKKKEARRIWKPLFSMMNVIVPWQGQGGSSPRRTGCASPSAQPPPPRAGCSRRRDHSAVSDRPAGPWRRRGCTCAGTWG